MDENFMMTMTITTNTGSRARIWNPKVKSVQWGSTELGSSSCVEECHWCQFNFTSSWFHVTHSSSSGASYTSVRSFSLRYTVTLWYSFVTPQVELAVSKMDANDKSWRECYAYSRHAIKPTGKGSEDDDPAAAIPMRWAHC
jgi:hypothetical protein